MKRIIYYLFVLFFISGPAVYAQDQKTGNDQANPGSDAEYTFLLKEYTLNADRSMDYHYVKEQKLLSYRAFHNLYGETFISYNPGFQKLTVNKCFTIMADGKKVEAPSNSFNEVLPSFSASAPAFNALREMVITHTGLERGAVVHLDYSIHTSAGNAPALMGNEILAEYEPVKDLTLKVKVPQNEKLFYKLISGAVEPQKSIENGFQVYAWYSQNIASISQEEFQKNAYEAYPRIIFSSSGSRNTVYEYLTNQPAFGMKISDAMKAEVQAIKKENPDQLSVALKIQEKVINEIRLWPVPMKYSAYRLHTAEEAWTCMGAILAEKAILMSALIEAAGIEADPVAIVRGSFFDEKLGTLADIEDFAVRIDLKDAGVQYLSLVSANQQDLGKILSDKVFVALGQGEKAEYQHSGSAKFAVNMSGTFIVSSDPKLTGEMSLESGGGSNPFLSLIRDKNKMKILVTGDISKSDIKEVKVSQSSPETSFQTYTIMDEKPFRKDSSWYHFTIPFCSGGIESWGMKTLSSKRSQAVEIPYSGEENYEYKLTLPSGYILFTQATKIDLNNKAGRYFFDLKQEGSKLTISRKIRLSDRIISPENYNDFKALMDNWNNPRLREVILSRSY
ncbi:MAG: DUF3857 domain-containing protein [Bacteroidetes bacterium]|nr:DUF3857 domain-containing protein [Bacteroidota bacterium]